MQLWNVLEQAPHTNISIPAGSLLHYNNYHSPQYLHSSTFHSKCRLSSTPNTSIYTFHYLHTPRGSFSIHHNIALPFFFSAVSREWRAREEEPSLFIFLLSVRKLEREERDLRFILPSIRELVTSQRPNFLHSSRKLEQGRGRADGLQFWTVREEKNFAAASRVC